MGVLLGDGKYQVMESLYSEPGYTASVCINVETKNNYKEYIFNIFTDPVHISHYLPIFHELHSNICGEFREILPGNGCVMAVFDYHKGIPLHNHLKSLKKDDYPARAQAVGSFLDAALVLDALPPVFAVSVFCPPYTVYDQKTNAVRLNYLIRPRAEPDAEETRALFVPYLQSAFIKNRYLPETAVDFLLKVHSGEITGFVSICSAWRRISVQAMEEHEKYLKESIFGYLKRRMSKKARKKLKALKKGRRERH